ncbi:hypothetical protein H2200_012849 [Cladophialophora chaetospira]|uniref:Uncharacterized protein n=1 Tax=Cladophialophora chaetospira TaxID=386627 RepID=A0AA38WWX7_9EURO|nr:hypothetical protein H2200_012849 [Cladophialophora chaetospira]
MPTEIADSDAESDLGSPPKQAYRITQVDEETKPHASPSVIDFDQFLDQTQRLSSSATNHLSGISQLDGAGDNSNHPESNATIARTNLTSLTLDMSPAVKSKKRAHSVLQGGSKDLSHEPDKKSKSKRSKTYGAISKSRSSIGDDLFAPSLPQPTENESSLSIDAGTTGIAQEISDSHRAHATPDLSAATTFSGQNGETSFLGRAAPDATSLMTTSLASMGQYHSINLDFRGGLDVNANPFGPPTQMSLVGDPDPAGMDHLANAYEGPEESLYTHTDASNFDPIADQPLPAVSQSSPNRPLAVDPADLIRSDATSDVPGHAHELDNIAEINEDAADVALPSTERPAPKKRGRKAKNSTLASKSRADQDGDNVEDSTLTSMPPPGRSRLGTVDSVSQASEASGPISSTRKRKRGKSKQIAEEPPANAAESSPVKQSNGELGLSDESIIGLPKEAYKPRPSRSRSKVVAEEEEDMAPPRADDSSPVKPPSSGPNLSDEAAIGVPKDNYKPRPSRSRSKKVVEEEVPDIPVPEPELDHHTPAKSITVNVPEETPTLPSTKSSTKKGRKAKVKRAKTSAAALLKKTDPMLSDGEEDVMWMETKPAPVKLDLPPALKTVKKEVDLPDEEDEDVVSHKRTKGKANNITIEIPLNPETNNHAAEPKKRGRKPKKTAQKSAEKIVDEEDEAQPHEDNTAPRPPLAEKPSNISPPNESEKGKNSKKTPTISPFTSPEPEVRAQPKLSKSPAKSNANQPVTTPAKPKATSAEKGLTKHSPIAHLTTSTKKAIYRVGLSRRQNIPSLLRKVDRDKGPVKNVVIKQKERKVKMDENWDGEEGGGNDPGEMRGADGMLVEWEF